MKTIFRKEVTDYFTSIRFVVLLILALLVCVSTIWFDLQHIRGNSPNDTAFVFLKLFTTQPEGIAGMFSFITFICLLDILCWCGYLIFVLT